MLNLKLPSIALLSLALFQTGQASESPKLYTETQAPSNQFWWPERLDLAPLRQHSAESNPMDKKI